MNIYGEEWLKDWLFATANDLYEDGGVRKNKKGYATAFESVVGFLYLRYPSKVMNILRTHFPKRKMQTAYKISQAEAALRKKEKKAEEGAFAQQNS